MKALRIVGWSRFEKSDHKKCKNMTWVATPTSHDGIGFLRLLTSPEGLRKYGGWHLILQVAAKCPTHGLLVSDAGRPLGAIEIALKTRANEIDITDAIQACCEIGWLEYVEIPDAAPESSGETPQSSCLQDRTGQDKTGEDRAPESPTPPAAGKPGERTKAVLRGLGLRATDDTAQEWADLARRRAKCAAPDDMLKFIPWAVEQAKKDGVAVQYAREVAIYADRWAQR